MPGLRSTRGHLERNPRSLGMRLLQLDREIPDAGGEMSRRWTVEPAINGEDGNPLWYYINGENGEPIASTWSGNESARERALDHARLMAAAPVMLRALALIARWATGDHDGELSLEEVIEFAQEVYAEANGGES